MAEAEIKYCYPCKDTEAARWQDKTYGKGMRVHNPMVKKGEKVSYRCTICSSVK